MNLKAQTDNEYRHIETIGNIRKDNSALRFVPDPFCALPEPTNRQERRAFKALKTHNRKAAKRGAQR